MAYKSKSHLYIWIVLPLLAVLLAGCVQESAQPTWVPPPSSQQPAYVPPEDTPTPTEHGELTLSMRNPKTLNPLLNEDATVDRVLSLIFEPLFMLDERWRPVPNLAESVEVSEDGMSALVTLRNDVVWSDGRSLSADDLIFSLDTLQKAGEKAIYKHVMENVASFEPAGALSVRISYLRPSGVLKYDLCFPLVARHYYQAETSADSGANMSPMGNGMYRMDAYKPAESMTLVSSPYSFSEKAYIEKLIVLITPDRETDLYAFNESIIDVVNTSIAEWGRYRVTKEANIAEYPSDDYDFIGFNLSKPLWSDKLVRTAVACAIDVDDIVESIYLNHADRAYTPVNPASWAYEPVVSAYEFDMVRAAQLLEEAQVEQDSAFSILVNEENAERLKIAGILRDNLTKLGLECFVYKLPFSEYERALTDRDFDLVVGGFTMGVMPDISFAFHSESSSGDNGLNIFSYNNETLDALLEQAEVATSDNAFTSYLSEAQKLIAEDLPCVSLVFRKGALLTHQKVKGDILPTESNIFANINEWFINETTGDIEY